MPLPMSVGGGVGETGYTDVEEIRMNDDKKLQQLADALPGSWLKKDTLLALIKVILALHDLLDTLDAKTKLNAAPPTELTWEVINGDEEDGRGVE